ncbi:threonine/serine exporter family protein [Chitinibacteraceae bacterium HSL-7]
MNLIEISRITLDAGLLVHQCGGDTARTTDTVRRLALALGADSAHTLVSSLNLGVTVTRDTQQHAAFRRAPHLGVNFQTITAVEHALNALIAGRIDAAQFDARIQSIASHPPHYPWWLVVPAVGLSCGAFAALFGGDAAAIFYTFIGATAGAWLRRAMVMRHYPPLAFAVAASALAASITGLLPGSGTPQAALAASVLFLVPGVPLINGASDLLAHNYLNGWVRLLMATVIIVGISIGMSLALRIVT